MVLHLVIVRLHGAPVRGVGAGDVEGLQDFFKCVASVVPAGEGARVAVLLVHESAMAGRADRMPNDALRVNKKTHHDVF